MSQKTFAHKYLEEEQRLAYERLKISPYDLKTELKILMPDVIRNELAQRGNFDSSQLDDSVKEGMKVMQKIYSDVKLPTKYENPGFYIVMKDLVRDLEKGMKSIRFSKGETELKLNEIFPNVSKPLFGTMPTGNVNALSRYFDQSDEYLVIFDDELFMYCNLISKVIARAMPVTNKEKKAISFSNQPEDIKKTIEQNKIILERFKDLVVSYLMKGRPSRAKQYHLENPYGYLSDNLRDGMETFVLAHEYGHIFLGHLNNTETTATALAEENAKKIIFSWNQELEADTFAITMTLAAMQNKGWDIPLSYWGGELLFSSFEIIEKSLAILKYGHDDFYWSGGVKGGSVGTHPPGETRRKNLREFMLKKFDKHSIALGKSAEEAVQILWNETKPIILKYYDKKRNPSSRWRYKES